MKIKHLAAILALTFSGCQSVRVRLEYAGASLTIAGAGKPAPLPAELPKPEHLAK